MAGTNPSASLRFETGPAVRHRRWAPATVVLALVPLLVALGIILWVNRTRIALPDNSRVSVDAEGNDVRAMERIPTEQPPHTVRISKPFYLGKFEVTQAQWQAVMGDNPSASRDPTNPVELVSFEDIQPFLTQLNTAYGRKGRSYELPTEA